jgi:hypothetical protein
MPDKEQFQKWRYALQAISQFKFYLSVIDAIAHGTYPQTITFLLDSRGQKYPVEWPNETLSGCCLSVDNQRYCFLFFIIAVITFP